MSWWNNFIFIYIFFDAILIVLALSFADIPVVIPFFASIETVNAVLFLDWFIGDIKDKFNLFAWHYLMQDKLIHDHT